MERVGIIKFTIEGKPEPQGRPRAVRMGAGVRMYDPPKSKVFKQAVSMKGRAYMSRSHLEAYTGALSVELDFYFIPPKSYTKKRLKSIIDKEELYVKKPDLDNLAKGVLDALNGICFEDDAQIVEMTLRKHYSDIECTDLVINTIEKGAN